MMVPLLFELEPVLPPEKSEPIPVKPLKLFSFYFGTGLDEVKFFDAGDMEVMLGNPAPMVENVKDTASMFLKDSRKLVGIGGEHLITYPLFMAAQKKASGPIDAPSGCACRSGRGDVW